MLHALGPCSVSHTHRDPGTAAFQQRSKTRRAWHSDLTRWYKPVEFCSVIAAQLQLAAFAHSTWDLGAVKRDLHKENGQKTKGMEGGETAKGSCVLWALLIPKACEIFHAVRSKFSLLSSTYHSLIYRPTILCLEIEKLNPFRAFFFFARYGIFSALKENPLQLIASSVVQSTRQPVWVWCWRHQLVIYTILHSRAGAANEVLPK